MSTSDGATLPFVLEDRIPSSLVQIDLGARSDTGKVRPNNEDHFLVARFDRAMSPLLTNLPAGHIPDRYAETAYGILVADGMGGEAGGEVASRTAISSLVDLVLRAPSWLMRLDQESARELLARMDRRITHLESVLVDMARANPSLSGMGTTLTAVCSLGSELFIGHIGDSRAYLFRFGRLFRLTHDHTMAQALADAGAISPGDVDRHPYRHVLTHVIGTKGGKAQAELGTMRLIDGDGVLLCTDGLTDMVTEEAITETLQKPGAAADACNALIEMALEAGGRDNVTVVLARYRIPE
jgi:serine/threonine protein phosphatase PrpC